MSPGAQDHLVRIAVISWEKHQVRKAVFAFLSVSLVPADTWARGWELALLAGWTAPTYEQTFQYDPRISVASPFPGVDIR